MESQFKYHVSSASISFKHWLSSLRFFLKPARLFCHVLLIILFGVLWSSAQTKPVLQNPPLTNVGQPELDDEQLLAYLLSEKSANLHQWGSINQFHGLPSDRVNAIAQTSDGSLWFGTDLGLAKFDGRRVQTVSTDAFSNLRINCLKTDQSGNLWIGTKKGAYQFFNDSFRLIPQTNDFSIVSILFSAPGQTFMAAANGTVFVVEADDQGQLQSRIFTSEEFEIESLGLLNADILIGTKSAGLLSVPENLPQNPRVVSRLSNIKAISSNSDGLLAFGASNGVYYGTSTAILKPLGENIGAVNALYFGADEDLWIASNSQGAFLFSNFVEKNRFTFENTAGGLRSNEVYAVFVDRENVVWFGTAKGVSRFDPNSPFTENLSADLNSKFIRSLYSTRDGRVFAGTNRGLFVRQSGGEWNVVANFETKTIYSIGEDISGKIWIGSSRGLFELKDSVSPNSLKTAPNENNQTDEGSVRAIRNFRQRTFQAVFGHGLTELKNSVSTLIPSNPPEIRNLLSLNTDGDQKLWLGTAENGVFYYDGHQILSEPALSALKNKAVWAIEGTLEKGLWLATQSGLFRFHKGELQTILSDMDVRAITFSPNFSDVWCATEKDGLIRVTFDSEFGWITSRLDVEQGLPSQKIFTLLSLSSENLLIGTNRGIVRYKIPATKPLLKPTRILSRRLHEPAELTSPLTLEFPQNALTVEVTALSSRTFPEQFQYGYILRDQSGAVIAKKFTREAQFLMENLLAGEYLLEVRAFDKNLISSLPLTVAFRVEKAPFPWFTVLLGVLLLITLTALIWAFISQRRIFQTSAALRRTNVELNAARLDLANEAERERRRISRDLHDQTLADLRHLQLLSDRLHSTDKNTEGLKTFRSEIENVSQEIRRICEDLSPSVLENIGFTAALEYALTNVSTDKPNGRKLAASFSCAENLEDKLSISATEQIQIFRIVQEVLNNILRHAEASQITVTAEIIGQNIFCLRIMDDGRGFALEKTRVVNGRGLSNIKSRSALIEAEFAFRPMPEGGTVFELKKASPSNITTEIQEF